jgi:hypothetical protein
MEAGPDILKSTDAPGGVVGRPFILQATPALRAEDLLSLVFTFFNLTASTPAKGQLLLSPTDPKVPSYIVATFPPQHIAEQAYFEAAASYPVSSPPGPDVKPNASDPVQGLAETRLAGASRLVFQVPAGAAPIPLTLTDLLFRCSVLEPSVAKAAFGPRYLDATTISTTPPRDSATRTPRSSTGPRPASRSRRPRWSGPSPPPPLRRRPRRRSSCRTA